MAVQDLKSKAMLVRLQISMPAASKKDNIVTQEVIEQKNAASDAGSFSKKLFVHPLFKAVTTAVAELRQFHYAYTMPWDDRKARLLPVKAYEEYKAGFQNRKEKVVDAIDALVNEYDAIVAQRIKDLNGMASEEDFPTKDEIAQKFDIEVEFDPIPTVDDFRVNLADEEIAAIRKENEQRYERKLQDSTSEIYAKIDKFITVMIDNLSNDRRLYETLFTNLADVVDIIPIMNIVDDQKLNNVAAEIKRKILVYSKTDIKADESLKPKLVEAATEIKQMLSAEDNDEALDMFYRAAA